ncbi:MAG: TonB-dependent receptor, partial [Novosphingobium sp.]
DSNSSRVAGARAMLGVEPGQGWRLDMTGFAQWLETRNSGYVYAAGSYARPNQIAEPRDNDLRHLAGRLSGAIGSIDVLLASAMTWHEVGDRLDATIGAESFGLADPQTFDDERTFRVWDNDLRLRGHLGSLKWLAGLSHLEARQTLLATLNGASGGKVTADVDLALPVTSRFSLDGGARLFASSVHEKRLVASHLISRGQSKAGMTPSFAIAWQPHANRLLYLRYGSAFRQGGSDIADNGTIETLKGDELGSIEAGWRERLPGGGRIEVSAWYTRWDDVQSDVLRTNGLIETTNAGYARIIGVEGAAGFMPVSGWHVEAGANYTNALLTHSALGYELHDRHLPVVPEYTVRVALRHDFALGSADAWARMSLRYVGPSRMSFDPGLDRTMGNLVESTFEVHARLRAWDLGLRVQNLFADKGNTFAFGNPFRYRTMPQYTPQRPMVLNLLVSRAF